MNILLLCEWRSSDTGVQIRSALQSTLEREGHSVQTIVLNHKEFKPCVGCFGCWLKTPGQCLVTDDAANSIASLVINADAVVLISEITYGGFSADIKAFLDRSIQNIMPYLVKYKGETHHPLRYKRSPVLISVGYGNASDAERRTFIALAERNALNKRPPRHLAVVVENRDELAKEASNILKTLEAGGI